MSRETKPQRILMIGPDPKGMGGIAHVVHLWQIGGYFTEFHIDYIPSVKEGEGKLKVLFAGLWRLVIFCLGGCRGVYIHTASQNSFYRKSLFMSLALLMGRRLIVHIHPSYFSQFLSRLSGFRKIFARALLSRAEFFVVLTPEIKENMANLFPGKPIHVLNNPIDVEGMKNNRGIKRKSGHILYLGWYMRRKGIYDLVDAIGMLLTDNHDVSADFYGTKEVEELRRYVSERGLDDKVRINGWIGEDDKLIALYGCNLLVLPSHTEGIPNVILEAMATKTPIVSTLVGGLKDILRDGENAVIAETENPEDLSKKILAVMQNQRLADHIASNAYKEACEKYDLPLIKKQLQAILKCASM